MNRIIRTILLVIMFASLAGCEGGCGDEVNNEIVFENNSDISVNAEVMFGSGGATDANENTVIIPPHDRATFRIGSNNSYAATARPMNDWLRTAENRRTELNEKLKSARLQLTADENIINGRSILNPIALVQWTIKTNKDREVITGLETELKQLQADIIAFKAQVTKSKSCRGIVSNVDAVDQGFSYARVSNGEDANSIRISCVDPKE